MRTTTCFVKLVARRQPTGTDARAHFDRVTGDQPLHVAGSRVGTQAGARSAVARIQRPPRRLIPRHRAEKLSRVKPPSFPWVSWYGGQERASDCAIGLYNHF